MPEEFEIADVWVGTFSNAAAANEYFEDDSDGKSKFASNMRGSAQINQFVRRSFHRRPFTKLLERLKSLRLPPVLILTLNGHIANGVG